MNVKVRTKRKSRILRKVYTFIILFSPILNVYGISRSFSTFSLREVAYLLLCLSIAISGLRSTIRIGKTEKCGMLFLGSTLLGLSISILLLPDTVSVLRVMRFILLNVTVLLFAREYFDVDYAVKIFRIIAITATIFLFIQLLSRNILNKYIPGYLQFLPIRQRGLYVSTQAILHLSSLNTSVRYSSFFEEPAYYASYVCTFLSIYLWRNEKVKPIIVFVLSAGVLLSTSILGLAALVFVFALYFFSTNRNSLNGSPSNKEIKRRSIKLGLILVFIIVFVIVGKTEQFQLLLNRISSGLSADARFVGYSMYFNSLREMPFVVFMFGNSMSEQTLIIVSGYVVILYYFGWVGYSIFTAFMVLMIKRARRSGLLSAALLLLFLNIGSSEFAAGMSYMIITAFILAQEPYKEPGKVVTRVCTTPIYDH